jgi:rhodanese-related sulfurtransferase
VRERASSTATSTARPAAPAAHRAALARAGDRAGTLIVLYDDDGSLSALAAPTLAEMGYSDVFVLTGGLAAWRRAGHPVVQGLNVPSKVFGERVLHEFKTPEVTPLELSAQMAEGRDMVIVDTRTPEEYARGCLPGAWSMPGGELVLRIGEVVERPDQTIVVHCGGRTRSYLGAESLRRMGLPNPIVAVRNGTMGWQLDGLELERGASRWPPAPSEASRARALEVAARVAREDATPLVSPEAVAERWSRRSARTSPVRRADPGGVRRRARTRSSWVPAARRCRPPTTTWRCGRLAGPDLRRLRPLDHDRGLAQAHGLPPRRGAGGRRARVAALGPPPRHSESRSPRRSASRRRARGRAGAAGARPATRWW